MIINFMPLSKVNSVTLSMARFK
ncbi:hypothetical protein CY0110_18832 [Crocosphaera chwakensis CCY0110]|uniref:Uncharacterized protein n=1 Tax=Crocosphaera chwakensis CCY0110 TaxID=391612 RepID=A3IJ98_9CHRO|nr:hypothetical protein CY0110_18832 [Crocosphaera chwakensis CCY0110]